MSRSREIVPYTLQSPMGIKHVRLNETLLPGETAAGYVVMQRENLWYDTDTDIIIADNYDRVDGTSDVVIGQNFGLAGEMFLVRYDPGNQVYQCVGSQGLLRRCKADAAITAGGEGTVSVWYAASAASCTGTDSTVNITACSDDSIATGDFVWVHYQASFKKWMVISSGSGGILRYGVLENNLGDPPATETVHLYEQSGTGDPTRITPDLDVTVMNFTSTELKAGPLMKVETVEYFEALACFPAQIEGCLTPEFDPNNDAANGGAVTASVGENVRYDPDGASGAVTITFPESTTLQDGETFRTENWNQTSTTGITLQANSGSPLDKIENPSDRTAAYASSHAGVVTTRYVVDWALDTNNYGNPTWKVASLLDS